MVSPVFVLSPASSKYNPVLLSVGANTVGRSRETGIASQSVSREHFKVLVENNKCRVRIIQKASFCVLKVDAYRVREDWVEFPEGASLELRTATDVSYKYRLERYKSAIPPSLPAAPCSQGTCSSDRGASMVTLGKRNEKFCESFSCPVCHEVLFEPTELECPGRHLFCRECIPGLLPARRCPVCREDIGRTSKKPKLKPQCVGLVEDTVKWMIESRMFDYGDETQWRERAHLPPLPPIPEPSDVQPPPGIHGTSNDSGGAPGSVVGVGGDSRKRANTSGGSSFLAASEVINLMSDSDDD